MECDGRVLPLFEAAEDRPEVDVLRAGNGAFQQQIVRERLSGRAYLIKGGRV